MGPSPSKTTGGAPATPLIISKTTGLQDQEDPPRANAMFDLSFLNSLQPREKVTFEDFEPIRTIGKGSFGKVILVRKKNTDNYYALKILRKSDIIEGDQVQHILTEKNVLQQINHPFIINLRFAFQTEKKLFLVMDFANGGDVFYHLKQEKRFSEDRCRLYAAEITLAFGALHEKNIIYRDLKPENVLLGSDGHIYLTDFGLSKQNITNESQATTFCGTPEYLAPEMLVSGGHGKAVDWWALGTFLYEILVGIPPFYSNNRNEMFRQILEKQLTPPKDISPDARDILLRLLERDPNKRLGGGDRDAAEVKEHPFFASLDWGDVYAKRTKPSYIPKIRSPEDLSHIDPEFLSEPPLDEDDLAEISRAREFRSETRAVHTTDGKVDEDESGQFAGFSFTGLEPEEEKETKATLLSSAISDSMQQELVTQPKVAPVPPPSQPE
ncbi:putative RAC family serine/threonine-protein kinase like protein [Blattamonas nauphoetae]|uniref:RAC family serine/threonine-protein kinase like protein n=1 Tax=Blattamonas nauphoetae TaxID=2049346 RepID=A0ABQ9YHJ3_9EUKA|nr:putative RAC family serine/threonine-protein kinase like protein [Blattamonas nauphoetae]